MLWEASVLPPPDYPKWGAPDPQPSSLYTVESWVGASGALAAFLDSRIIFAKEKKGEKKNQYLFSMTVSPNAKFLSWLWMGGRRRRGRKVATGKQSIFLSSSSFFLKEAFFGRRDIKRLFSGKEREVVVVIFCAISAVSQKNQEDSCFCSLFLFFSDETPPGNT